MAISGNALPASGNGSTSFPEINRIVQHRLRRNLRVRRNLPGGGRLRIDRQLPFLCVYRCPQNQADIGTRELNTTEASYLNAVADERYRSGVANLCRTVAETMLEHFGAFLILEIWAADVEDANGTELLPRPAFRICTDEADSLPTMIAVLNSSLSEIRIASRPATVTVESGGRTGPRGLPPLNDCCPRRAACFYLGIEVRPIYRDRNNQSLYPVVLQQLRRQFSAAIRKAIFAFTGAEQNDPADQFHTLGPSSLVKAARIVDQQLCEVSESFDLLLQVTPTNSDAAWSEFQDSDFEEPPTFYYRPLPYLPGQLKRRLFDIEIERIEDVTLAHLFQQKQDELDRQITALKDINTPQFVHNSLQLHGGVEDDLLRLALDILTTVPPDPPADEERLDARAIVARARQHVDRYHNRQPGFRASIEVCDHIASGIMVSQDHLYISSSSCLSAHRVEALLHHEVGTHLLTYFNGRQQPFRQLYAGLAGYEALQEGLAVMAEYLVGGLTANRLRTLAGRVLAVRAMLDGNDFVSTFRLLHHTHQIASRLAFTTALRVHRAGGFTKDAIYLRGLRDLLEYLHQGHDIEPLYVGKISLAHVPFVQELRRRRIIQPPALLPAFRDSEASRDRLETCRNLSVLNLLDNE